MTTTQNLPNTPASPLTSGCFNSPPFLLPSSGGLPASPFLLAIRLAFEDGTRILLGFGLVLVLGLTLGGTAYLLVHQTILGIAALVGVVFSGAFLVRLALLRGYLS
jgi:hypothetical protein